MDARRPEDDGGESMSAETADRRRKDGVEFIHESDGRITARDVESGVASYGETKSDALAMLAEALELHAGGGDPVTDEDLREFGLDPDDDSDRDLPEFMR
jgi:hypothetical protein